MKDFNIIFDNSENVSLPNGACLGVVGEHNAVQLVITLPESMIENMDYHTVTIGGIESARIVSTSENVDGAFRVGSVIYQPLTAAYTESRIVDLSVTAYKQLGDAAQVVDKTPTVYGLRFDGGTPHKVPGGLAAEVAALAQKVAKLKGLATVQTLPDSPEADTVVYLDGVGIYHYTGTEWEQLSDNGEGLKKLEESIDAICDDLPSAAEIERWNTAAGAKHSHENKPSLDKILVSSSYASLPNNVNEGTVGIVNGKDVVDKPFSEFDPVTDADSQLSVYTSLEYDSTLYSDGDFLTLISENENDISSFLIGVYTDGSSDPEFGIFNSYIKTEAVDPKAYVVATVTSAMDIEAINTLLGIETEDEETVIFLYAFESVAGGVLQTEEAEYGSSFSLDQGWNILVFVEGDTVDTYYSAIADPNDYINIGTFEEYEAEAQNQYLYDVFRLRHSTDNRGLYYKANGQWVKFYDAELTALADRLCALENSAPDDVTLLGFETYNDLVVRDEAGIGESIQDVPVYVHGGTGLICQLYTYTADPVGLGYDDGIELVELRQRDTGMPLRTLVVTVGGTRYAYYPQDYKNESGVTLVAAGWNTGNQPTDPPTIADFAPDRFAFGGSVYGANVQMPDDAQSVLRSLSQCVNVSAAAMGTIRVPDDAVQRFAGTFEPNRKYMFTTDDDCEFTLPTVPWSEQDAQFLLYLTCTADVDLTFPQTTHFAGGTAPNSDAGLHKLIGCWLKDADTWAIGGVDYEAVT